MLLLVEQTNYCNLKCVGCPNRLHLRPRSIMMPEMFRDICDQFVAHGPPLARIALHGTGEPLLSPHLGENLGYLDELGFDNVDFTSNGLLLTEEVSRGIVEHRCLSWFRMSLNSSRPDLHTRINTGSDFERVVENIKGFLGVWEGAGRPFGVWVQLMRTRANPDENAEDIFHLLGRRDFEVREKRYNTFAGLTRDNELAFQDWPGRGRCVYGDSDMYIHSDGDIVGCCMDPTKWQVYGNVRDGIFSQKVQGRRKELAIAQRRGDFRELPLCLLCTEPFRRMDKAII